MKRAVFVLGFVVCAAPASAQLPEAHHHPPAPVMAVAVLPDQRGGGGQAPVEVPWNDAVAPGTPEHAARALKESSRHGEWVDITLADGTALKTWVVYPERATKAGAVLVIHDIRGMADIPRAVGDQLAQDGFIAIVPDFLSGKGPNGGGTESLGAGVGKAIQSLTPAEVNARLDAAMEYGRKLPASNGRVGVVGFCWGGTRSFGFAVHQPSLNAAVVYYGSLDGATAENAPADDVMKIRAPVLGLYAGNDARINTTLPPTQAAMKQHGKSYEIRTFDGAGHGFLGNQAGAAGANLKAALQAWPLTVEFFRRHLQQ